MSEKINRYELFRDNIPVGLDVAYMEAYEMGRYCKYEDVQKLEQKVSRLIGVLLTEQLENHKLKKEIEEYKKRW